MIIVNIEIMEEITHAKKPNTTTILYWSKGREENGTELLNRIPRSISSRMASEIVVYKTVPKKSI